MVLSHARALLAGPGVAAVAADLRDPAAVLADPELRALIDPAEPVCVILGAVLHFLDADAAREVTAEYARLIAPDSCLVISCAAYDDEALAKRLAAEYTAGQFVNHTREDVVSFFAGLELVGPGVTEAQTWRPWTVPASAAAPRGPRAGRRGPASTLTSSAPACTAQVSAVSGTSSPVAGAAEHHALRHALAGDAGDAAHGAGKPAVVELQGAGQVGALAAVGVVPRCGQGGQFPDGMDVAGPAVPQLVAAVLLAQHGIGPPPQLGQLRRVCLAVQADPVRGGGPAGCGGVQGVGDGLGEFLEAGGEVQVAAEPGAVEALVYQRDLAAQGGYLAARAARLSPRACAGGSACGLVIVFLGRAVGERPDR